MVQAGKKYHAPQDAGNPWLLAHPLRVMAIVESYVMVRRKGGGPFVLPIQKTLQWTPVSKSRV